MTYETALSVLGLLGIGGAVGTWIKTLLDRKSEAIRGRNELKESRYKCTLVLMYALLNDAERVQKLRLIRPDIKSREDLLNEIAMEWHNMILVASDSVLRELHAFSRSPSSKQFKRVALEMRRDLWGGAIVTDLDLLSFDSSAD